MFIKIMPNEIQKIVHRMFREGLKHVGGKPELGKEKWERYAYWFSMMNAFNRLSDDWSMQYPYGMNIQILETEKDTMEAVIQILRDDFWEYDNG